MDMLLDIHSHHQNKKNGLAFVVGQHSLGVHPWELKIPFNESSIKENFLLLKSKFHSGVLAIGECGLDRRREGIAALEDQEKVLLWHIEWAQVVKRPLILHCVKANSDLLKLLKERKYKGKILLHDFSGNLEEARAFLSFDTYFSFGRSLFREDQKAADVLMNLPKDRIFLETDDQLIYSIDDIYQKAEEILGMDSAKCEEQFISNLSEFLNLDDVSPSDVINYLR